MNGDIDMTNVSETSKTQRTEKFLTRKFRAARDSYKISDLIEALGKTWLSDPDMGQHAWMVYKDERGFMYMKVYQPGCTRLGAILRAVSTVKMTGYVCGYNEREDYLTLRIFS